MATDPAASRFWGGGSDDDSSDESSSTSSGSTSSDDSSSSSDNSSSSSSGSDSSGSDSDSSSSDSDSSTSSSDSERGGANRFLVGSSDSDSDDGRRVVRSAKDKALEELRSACDEIRNKMNINDWSAIQTLFDKLHKQADKAQKALGASAPPRVYIKQLAELEDFLTATLANAEAKKKMSPTNARALNTMRQRLRKHNAGLAAHLDAWRANPVSSESEPEAGGGDSDSDGGGAKRGKRRGSASAGGDDGDGSDGDAGFERVRSRADKRRDRIMSMDPKDITWTLVAAKLREVVTVRGKKGVDRQEQVDMLQYLASVAKGPAQRTQALVHLVSALFDVNPSMASHMAAPLWRRCVATLFEVVDLLASHPYIAMDEAVDADELGGVDAAAAVGGAAPAAAPAAADGGADAAAAAAAAAAGPVLVDEPVPGPGDPPLAVAGNLAAFVERLDDELYKSLQATDPHANAYLARLRDEPPLLALMAKAQAYLEGRGQAAAAARVASRQVEHFYHKSEAVYAAMQKLVAAQQAEGGGAGARPASAAPDADVGDLGAESEAGDDGGLDAGDVVLAIPADYAMDASGADLMARLTRAVYAHGDERAKARAALCAVYFAALHDDFYTARDGLLASHLQEAAPTMDVPTQVLYNRSLAQLGLAAFRAGLIPEAQAALGDMYASGRVKELLAQGMALGRYHTDRTPEQEKLERRRQVPFHMHINLEVLEAAHLVSAMLLEVPVLAAPADAGRARRPISKPFRRLLDNYDRQTFTGPPESVRDHVMAAARCLGGGDWKGADGHVRSLACWSLLGSPAKEAVLDKVTARLKVEGLRAYLLAHGGCAYASVSHDALVERFGLPAPDVHAIVSGMMADGTLAGSWDQPTRCIVMHAARPSRLQAAGAALAQRAAFLLDLNERALTLRTGGLRDEEGDEGGGRRGRGRGGPRLGGGGDDGDDEGGEGGRRGGRGRGRGRGGLLAGLGGGRGRGRGGGRGGGGDRRDRLGGGGSYGGGVYGDGRETRYTQRRQQQARLENLTALGSLPGRA